MVLLLLFIIVPSSFASDNGTVIQENSSLEVTNDAEFHVESLTVDDSNPKGVDYYFNSSSDEDGDGSIDNPYNSLTNSRLKAGSTIHLANGEYNLTSGKTLNKVTIIGEDSQKTIIRYSGYGGVGQFTLNIDNYATLSNVTFIGFNFDIEGATLQATNTVFKNSVAFNEYSSATNLVNSASNSFGGAIYAYSYADYYGSYTPTIILDNCSFVNNTAEYGGAIYINSGLLSITNSSFINNSAYNYGGAIAGVYDTSLKISNSLFENDTSVNDAGGAIYILRSMLSATNVSIYNCSATFGAAVTSLNSTTSISHFDAENNIAKYEGGAVYQMYNAIQIIDSTFKNNSARNGGALYVDGVQIFKLQYNNFEDNNALNTAGAVYSSLNSMMTVNNNNYTGNKAKKNNDYYETDSVTMFIGDGNYTLYFNNYTFDGVLPSYYSLIDEGFVTSIKDQQSGGNCWAFGSIAAIESAILKASGDNLDLSEENMKNLMQTFSDYGWSEIETNNGGYDEMAISYFTSWLGPVYESIELYDDYSMISPVLNAITHVQNIAYLSRSSYTDNDAIKEAIIKYGAVSTGIYYDSTYFYNSRNSYYYSGSDYANHAVAIVGWDDNYSSSNFYNKPAGNGAWIVKNSWGESWGNKGYFYVSYYDTKLAQVGVSDYSYVFIFNDTTKYDKNYQYDMVGKTDYFVTGENTIWVENIFNATDNELLSAVSTTFRKITDFDLFIYVNDQLALTKNGTCNPGYTTIELGEQISLAKGDVFKVVFRLSADSNVEFAISEEIASNQFNGRPGISYFSFDGINWTDLYAYAFETEVDGGHYYSNQVAAIKAFTILYELQPSIDLNYSAILNTINVTAIVHDQYNNLIRSGNVVFNICGVEYDVKIENSKANLVHTFDAIGNYDVIVSYKSASENISFNITKIFLDLNFDIVVDKNNAIINLISGFNVNTTLNLSINNKVHLIDFVNGKSALNLHDLDFGSYNVSAIVLDDVYVNEVNSTFNITISKTKLIANDAVVYYNSEIQHVLTLMDIYDNPVVNRPVTIILNGKSIYKITDDEGKVYTTIKFDDFGTYKMNIMFYGDENYFAVNSTVNINAKSTIIIPSDVYLTNSVFNATLLDSNGNPVVRNQINLRIDGIDYWLISDNNGTVSQKLNLKAGSHTVTISNPRNGEVLSKKITAVSRLSGNKNVNMYFGAGLTYTVRVYGDNGKVVGAGEKVKITIAGKSYIVKTDKKGYASYKISLPAKSYTITATYKGFKVSNKVVVKPVLTAKNISKKKSKTTKFTAKLVNSKGKVVKGKKITFKFKGKTYKIKTNKKGIATLTLKNLKVGKYTIKTTYGKSTIKNTIKIRK